MLHRHPPRGCSALVFVEPDLKLETLMRSGRANFLPISDPEEENLVSEQPDPQVLGAVERLRPELLMLAQPAAFDHPARCVRRADEARRAYVPARLVRSKLAIDRIYARFRLQEVHVGTAARS